MQRHPFSPGTSDRDPFPPFSAAMAAADEDEDQDSGRSALDWSIDSLAELKPVPMTPSAAQKAADAAPPTPLAADARRLSALLTPSPMTRDGRPPTARDRRATPEYARELHARCREAVELYQRRLRERQRRMDQLAVRADKRSATPSPSSWSVDRSPPVKRTRSSEKRNSTGSSGSASVLKTPGSGSSRLQSPNWWASPITRTSSFTSPGFVRTPSPSLAELTPGPMTKEPFTPIEKPSFVCELSPIAAGSDDIVAGQKDATKPPDEAAHSTSREVDNSIESPPSVEAEAHGDLGSKERGQDGSGVTPGKENHTPSQAEGSPSFSRKGSSVSRRQEQFAAAMEEAEALRRQSNESKRPYRVLSSIPDRSTGRAASILSLYAEAKAMGLSSPHAQWEYVRLLQSSAPASTSSRSSRSLSFDRSPSSTTRRR